MKYLICFLICFNNYHESLIKQKIQFSASKLNGKYEMHIYNESAKDQLYQNLNGGAFATIYFDGKGFGQVTSNTMGVEQTLNYEYSQDRNILKLHYLPEGSTIKWLVQDIKGDYAYIVIKVTSSGKKFILVKKH